MALYAELELFVAVVGQPHRQPISIKTRSDGVEREKRMVLGAVPDGGARKQLDRLDRESLVVLNHQRRDPSDLIRRLRAHDQMQRARLCVIPRIAVVGLQRAWVDRLREPAPVQYKLAFILARRFDGLFDIRSRIHAAPHRFIGFACDRKRIAHPAATPLFQHHRGRYEHSGRRFRRPHRIIAVKSAPDDGILHRRIDRRRGRGIAADPDIACRTVIGRRIRAGGGAVLHDILRKTQHPLRRLKAIEIVVHQKRHRMSDQRRRLPFGNQKVFAIEPGCQTFRLRNGHAVAEEFFMQDEAVRLQFRPQKAQVHALEYPVGPRCLDEECVGLLLGPTGQIACAKVPRERLLSGHFAQGVPPVTGLAVRRHPVQRTGSRMHFERMGIGQAPDHHGNTEKHAKFDKLASRTIHRHRFLQFEIPLRKNLQAS